MVDLIEYLENVDEQTAAFSILVIMILQGTILTFPGYILMIYAGFKFGLVTGAFINYIGLYLSCVIGYRIGRWSSSDLSKSPHPKLIKFNSWIQEKGIKVVIFLRILPIIPNNFTSIGSGFARISEKQHALYSGFTILQSFFFSFVGANLLKTVIGDLRLEITIYHGLALIFLFAILIYVKRILNSDTDLIEN